jgi:hypothetical protein
MRSLLAVLCPAATLAIFGCAAMPSGTGSGSADAVERNKALVRELTEAVWNRRGSIGSRTFTRLISWPTRSSMSSSRRVIASSCV